VKVRYDVEPIKNTARKMFQKLKGMAPGCISLVQIDDFYKALFSDAKTCSKVLGLPLESHSKGENSIPLIEIPNYMLKFCLKKMSSAGFKVAVYEPYEMEIGTGIVKRDTRRIVWPGARAD